MWKDSGTGLYYVRARYYDARTGRFLSRDPAEGQLNAPETLQPYVFANSNPYFFRDPSGLVFTSIGEVTASLVVMETLSAIATKALVIGAAAAIACAAHYGISRVSGSTGGICEKQDGERLITVSRWGRPGLYPGDWVMLGRATYRNYLLSFKWEPAWQWLPPEQRNIPAPFESGREYAVPKATVRFPFGWEAWKFVFGQRVYLGEQIP